MRGAGELLCGMPMSSSNLNGTAAFCRPNMPHTLRSPTGGVEAATAPPFTATQGLGCATGTRALSPRDPDFPSFPREKKENKKSGQVRRLPFSTARTGARREIGPRCAAVSIGRKRETFFCDRRMQRESRSRLFLIYKLSDAACVGRPAKHPQTTSSIANRNRRITKPTFGQRCAAAGSIFHNRWDND